MHSQKDDLIENNNIYYSTYLPKSRPSLIVKQVDIVNPTISLTTMEEFAQDLKFYTTNIFKEIKAFINKRENIPFSGEVMEK